MGIADWGRKNAESGRRKLEVVGFEACLFGDAGEHFGADFDSFVKSENEIRVVGVGEDFVGAGLAFDLPTDGKKGLQDSTALL